MGIFVAAEFDSVDFADRAAGRVRKVSGVVGAKVLRNRFAAEADDGGETVLPTIPAGVGFSNSSGMGLGSFVPFAYSFDGASGDRYEPSHRRDALLRVETIDDNAAGQVSAVLRNLGGRDVRIIHRAT